MEPVKTKTSESLDNEGDKGQDFERTDMQSEIVSKPKEKERQDDGAVPSTSSSCSATDLEEAASSKIQRARKRERNEDTDEDTDDNESKKYGNDSTEANAEKQEEATSIGNQGTSETCPFPRLKVTTRQRRYRCRNSNMSSSNSSSSSSCSSPCSESSNERPHDAAGSSSPPWHPDDSDSSDNSMIANRILDALHQHAQARGLALDSDDDTWSPLDSDDSDSDEADVSAGKDEPNDDEKKHQRCLSKEIPKHKWSVTKAVINRQLGMHTRQQESELFWQHCYGSLHSVKRLELMYKLEEHHGCVNAISFNQSGTRLASGSDDKKIIIWDWAFGKSLLTYSSGHTSNVFQAKFLPLSGDNHIVSSARDGQVRLAVLSSTGECRGTRRLAHHRRPVNKISLLPETPHVFLSAGEDARVMSIDVRCSKQSTLVTVKDSRKKIGLYSVDSHPLNSNEFCVCGVDYYIRIYDKRKINANGRPMKKFCPSHIHGTNKYTNVTCALYNHDGTEIVGSYNDESLYLFDTRHSDGADFVHKYEGHRNSATVKSCDFYGPNSEYIMSGSDCGHIFFWDKNTEAIVQFMRGDEKGVVNALVGHPQFPILATSGLDSDIKIWVPSCEQDPEMKDLKRVVCKNLRDRLNDQPYRMDFFGSPLQSTLDPDSNFGINISRLGGSFPVRVGARFLDDAEESSATSDSDNDGYQNTLQCPPS